VINEALKLGLKTFFSQNTQLFSQRLAPDYKPPSTY